MKLNWFKLSADFDRDDRIAMVEGSRNGAVAIYYYIKLHCIAARCNLQGGIFIADGIPHTPKTLAKQWRCKEITVNNTIELLSSAGLLEIHDNVLYISDWHTTQNADRLDEIRQNARLRKQRSRQKLALEKQYPSRDKCENVKPCPAAEEDKEKEKEIEGEGEAEPGKESDDALIADIVNHFNTTPFNKIKILSQKQKEALLCAVERFGAEQLKQCFTIASECEFLQGRNNKKWVACFDWLINPDNTAKVLNGNYNSIFGEESDVSDGMISSFSPDEFAIAARHMGF